MKIPRLHGWNVTPKEAVSLQRQLAGRIDRTKPLGRCELVAGADVSMNRFGKTVVAGVVLWRASTGELVERRSVVEDTSFPYVPGLLTFREAPSLIDAFRKLETEPDVVFVDGQGVAHPRRIGLAALVGLWLGVPSVGCAKTRLCGRFEPPGPEPGSTSPLIDREEVIGEVVRTKARTNPLFVSTGNLIDTAGAVRAVLACLRGYRLPEPTRLAHLYVNEERRKRLR
jgi:deoxyribonuclease V